MVITDINNIQELQEAAKFMGATSWMGGQSFDCKIIRDHEYPVYINHSLQNGVLLKDKILYGRMKYLDRGPLSSQFGKAISYKDIKKNSFKERHNSNL